MSGREPFCQWLLNATWALTSLPGTDDINQLECIVNVLGVKGNADLNFVGNEHAHKYIKSLPHSLGIPFTIIYPNANPLAIDLLKKMLVFDLAKRIHVTKVLQHPYMASFYDPLFYPIADDPVILVLMPMSRKTRSER
ncbi:hypothetical protein ZIOFF_071810 [Zingiber officinale]|uniref:Mitogen-activated protein kinase n=1 Tax=Zingiber officinale TaxID=94328 RepID=A0A8J5EQS6_ZINOF|nr:hypothetical protein ZIOFF_071810 [Zingiber officinale]